jgi:hypothetical protein
MSSTLDIDQNVAALAWRSAHRRALDDPGRVPGRVAACAAWASSVVKNNALEKPLDVRSST